MTGHDFIFIAKSIAEAVEAKRHMIALGMTVRAETWGGTWVIIKNGKEDNLVFGQNPVEIGTVARAKKIRADIGSGRFRMIRPWGLSKDTEIRLVGRKAVDPVPEQTYTEGQKGQT